MNPSRRKFTRVLALTAVAAPVAPAALIGQESSSDGAVETGMQTLAAIPMNDERAGQVRESIGDVQEQVQTLRAYELRRSVEPALNLGVFDQDALDDTL